MSIFQSLIVAGEWVGHAHWPGAGDTPTPGFSRWAQSLLNTKWDQKSYFPKGKPECYPRRKRNGAGQAKTIGIHPVFHGWQPRKTKRELVLPSSKTSHCSTRSSPALQGCWQQAVLPGEEMKQTLASDALQKLLAHYILLPSGSPSAALWPQFTFFSISFHFPSPQPFTMLWFSLPSEHNWEGAWHIGKA